jgi:hypothetical protein
MTRGLESTPECAPDELTSHEREFLLWGPDDRVGDAFDTEEQVFAAWQRHREPLLASCPPGRRPWGWRIFDCPWVPWHGYAKERATNWRANVLGIDEKLALEIEWQRDLARGRESDAPHELRRQYRSKKEPRSEIAQGQQSA